MLHRSALHLALLLGSAAAFAPAASPRRCLHLARPRAPLHLATLQADDEFSQTTRLRAEIESPFAKVRLFAFPALFLAAGIATYFAGTALLIPTPRGEEVIL